MTAFRLPDIHRLQLYTFAGDESDDRRHRRRCSVRGHQHHLRQQVLVLVAVYRTGVLQYVHDLPLHDAGALVHAASRARRSEIVRSRHPVDQSADLRDDSGAHGVRRSHRRHLHSVERDVRGQRGVPRVR